MKSLILKMPAPVQRAAKNLWYKLKIVTGDFSADEPEFFILNDLVGDGVAIDVGANVGHYTRRLSELCTHVIAYEPIPATFSHLSRNTSDLSNVTLINAAASKVCELQSMTIPDGNYYQAEIVEGGEIPILTVSIDSMMICQRVSFVKIDAEGHEEGVVGGMRELIERDKPVIVIETVTDSIDIFLRNLGYRGKVLTGSPNTLFTV